MTLDELDLLEHYKLIEDEPEMRWFFNHCVFKPKRNEVYAFCMASRRKMLSRDENENTHLGRSEMLSPNVVYPSANGEFTYEMWKKGIRKYECNKEAYTDCYGKPFSSKTLVLYTSLNPCDELGAIKSLKNYINIHEQELVNASMKNNNNVNLINSVLDAIESEDDNKIISLKEHILSSVKKCESSGTEQSLFKLSRSLTKFKRLQFDNIGTKYWVDFDMDFKENVSLEDRTVILDLWRTFCTQEVGKKNFVIILTNGGAHTIIKKEFMKFNPQWLIHTFLYFVAVGPIKPMRMLCKESPEVQNIKLSNPFRDGCLKNYKFCEMIKANIDYNLNKHELYNGVIILSQDSYAYNPSMYIKELVQNKNSLIPVPGTLQYGKCVSIMNKDDFN